MQELHVNDVEFELHTSLTVENFSMDAFNDGISDFGEFLGVYKQPCINYFM